MRGTDRRKLAVNLDQADQQGGAFEGLAAIGGMGKLVEVVADTGKLAAIQAPRLAAHAASASACRRGLSASARKARHPYSQQCPAICRALRR